jgi:hypothetical protein
VGGAGRVELCAGAGGAEIVFDPDVSVWASVIVGASADSADAAVAGDFDAGRDDEGGWAGFCRRDLAKAGCGFHEKKESCEELGGVLGVLEDASECLEFGVFALFGCHGFLVSFRGLGFSILGGVRYLAMAARTRSPTVQV